MHQLLKIAGIVLVLVLFASPAMAQAPAPRRWVPAA